jgi:broad specificity phosphatase PhoE
VVTLHLVRHGRPVVDPTVPAHEWTLDPASYDDVWALRERLPARAAWYSAPEPRATETVQLLTDAAVGVVDGLRGHRRPGWVEDFQDAVAQAFAHPDQPVRTGWEPLADCRARVVAAVEPMLVAHAGEQVVLVGHGTCWTVLVAALTGAPPDLERRTAPTLPDVIRLDLP